MDPVLDPLLGRLTIKKGRAIKIGDKEIDYNPNFRFILQVHRNMERWKGGVRGEEGRIAGNFVGEI